jgi:hypothetical protein
MCSFYDTSFPLWTEHCDAPAGIRVVLLEFSVRLLDSGVCMRGFFLLIMMLGLSVTLTGVSSDSFESQISLDFFSGDAAVGISGKPTVGGVLDLL